MDNYENKYKARLLEVLKAFTDITDANGLKYYAAFGTLLGAVRHKGYIPWDDDIDLYMPREDYNNLLTMKDELAKYGLAICSDRDKGYYMSFAKVYAKDSTMLEFENQPFTFGVYIDLFPLDSSSLNKDEIDQINNKYLRLWRIYIASLNNESIPQIFHSVTKYGAGYALRHLISKMILRPFRNVLQHKILAIEGKLNDNKGDKLVHFSAPYKNKHIMPKDWFEETKDLPFENITIKAPSKHDAYLSFMYGNYMEFPPVEKRITHHDRVYVNLTKSLTVEECLERVKKGYTEE